MANYAVKQIHKNMYPATHNFKDEVDGTSGTDISWIDTEVGTEETYSATIIALEDGHRKVIKFSAGGDNGKYVQWQHNETETADTKEWLWKYKDKGVGHFSFIGIRTAGADTIIDMYFNSADNKLYVKDGLGWHSFDTAADTWHHTKLTYSCATNKQSVWLNGILIVDDQNFVDNLDAASIPYFRFQFDTFAGANSAEAYVDAYGEVSDANYNVGDNIHWRNYKESTDSFEGDDVGTQGTSITWVDSVDTAASVEIVQEFNEHKKLLRGYYSSALGGYDSCNHTFASQAKTGWFAAWIKTSDATVEHRIQFFEDAIVIINFRFSGDKFQIHTAGAWRDVTNAPIPTDDTWYHIYIQWYDAATDTFDLWIDNILYEDGTNCVANQTSGINKCYLLYYSATQYIYIDAPMSSLDSDVRADNRTFEYNATYTMEDITTNIINVRYSNKIYEWRKATLSSTELFEKNLYIFQVYDINSVLAFEGEIKSKIQTGVLYSYSLRDKNWDDLHEPITHAFTTDDIHDPADSATMLLTALPNVGQEDGDLILVEGDAKTTVYSPTLKNYPTHLFLGDIADIADSCIIIKASGKCYLDDDLASGSSLDVDVAADKDSMTDDPKIIDRMESINYFEIFGAINPDTGERFYKIIDNSGTDKKRKWRYVNNEFRSQTDVDAYAAALGTRIITGKIIMIAVQGIGCHNMGTTFDYKFVHLPINIPQANYYIIEETISFDDNNHVIVLSSGMVEQSKYAAGFEKPQNYMDSFAGEIYETDINTILLELWAVGAARSSYGINMLTDEAMVAYFFCTDKVDTDRDITLTFSFFCSNIATIDGELDLYRYPSDGDTNFTVVENNLNFDVAFTTAARFNDVVYTLVAADSVQDTIMQIMYTNKDVTQVYMTQIQVQYYIKREV